MTPDNKDAESTENSSVSSENNDNEGAITHLPVSRRGSLALLGLAGLGALGSQSATAKPPQAWRIEQDADGHEISDLRALAMENNPTDITDFEGDGLAITDGELSVDFDALAIVAGRYLAFDEDVLNFTGAAEWENEVDTPVNAATGESSVVAGGEENEAVGQHATVSGGRDNEATGNLATVGGGERNRASGRAVIGGGNDNSASGSSATIGGGSDNSASDSSATIGGGFENDARGGVSTIGGGAENIAGIVATVGGGRDNNAGGIRSTIGGGRDNDAPGEEATVGGGRLNNASCRRSTIGGGYENLASGEGATVPGGRNNRATGDYSIAAGRGAKADHDGAFVVGNSTEDEVESVCYDEVRFQAGGGFVIEQLNKGDQAPLTYDPTTGEVLVDKSSTRYKRNIEPLEPDPGGVLELTPRSFEYTGSGTEGIGLIAEEVAEHVPELVITDREDRPDAVRYDRLGVYLVPEVRRQRDRIDELEREKTEVRERLASLEDHVGVTPIAADGGKAEAEDDSYHSC